MTKQILASRRTRFLAIGICAAGISGSAFVFAADSGATNIVFTPDWSGWWAMDMPLSDEWQLNPPPLVTGYERFLLARANDLDPDPLRYCRPWQFTGVTGDFVSGIEFLFTPGRVTIAGEDNSFRRIYLDPAAQRTAIEDSNTGTSFGHWEDDTLVIETTGIAAHVLFPGRRPGSMPIGSGVRIIERIRRVNTDSLQFEVTTEAPAVLTKPDHRIRRYHRVDRARADEVNVCVDYDRSIDPVSGKQRFDLTPPGDLPAPPLR